MGEFAACELVEGRMIFPATAIKVEPPVVLLCQFRGPFDGFVAEQPVGVWEAVLTAKKCECSWVVAEACVLGFFEGRGFHFGDWNGGESASEDGFDAGSEGVDGADDEGIAACFIAIPYVGTVLMLPLFVFGRSYSLYFLDQAQRRRAGQ